MKKGLTLSIIILLFCSSHLVSQQPAGNLTGKVVDSVTGKPVGSAFVSTSDSSFIAVTDEEGRFNLYYLLAGTHTLLVEKTGYDRRTVKSIHVSHNRTLDLVTPKLSPNNDPGRLYTTDEILDMPVEKLTYTLRLPSGISVITGTPGRGRQYLTILGYTGQVRIPVSSIKCTVLDSQTREPVGNAAVFVENSPFSGMTDNSGVIAFECVRIGEYTLRAQHKEYSTYRHETATLNESRGSSIVLLLNRKKN